VTLYIHPPDKSRVVCVDELGPVTPRTFAPAPGWSPNGHRIKALLDYGRGPDKAWIYGGLSPTDGQTVTMTAGARNSVNYCHFLGQVEQAHPEETLYVIVDNLSSHTSAKTQTWLADHPRIQQVFIPKGACWLNLQEGWWRLFRREALAGQTFADYSEIARATQVATQQLNRRAKPWIWGRPEKPPRYTRHVFTYRI
jgi:transposase